MEQKKLVSTAFSFNCAIKRGQWASRHHFSATTLTHLNGMQPLLMLFVIPVLFFRCIYLEKTWRFFLSWNLPSWISSHAVLYQCDKLSRSPPHFISQRSPTAPHHYSNTGLWCFSFSPLTALINHQPRVSVWRGLCMCVWVNYIQYVL